MASEMMADLGVNFLTRQALAYLDYFAEERTIAAGQKRDAYLEEAQSLAPIPGEEEPGVSRPSRAELMRYRVAGEFDKEVMEAEEMGRLVLQKSTELHWGGMASGVKTTIEQDGSVKLTIRGVRTFDKEVMEAERLGRLVLQKSTELHCGEMASGVEITIEQDGSVKLITREVRTSLLPF